MKRLIAAARSSVVMGLLALTATACSNEGSDKSEAGRGTLTLPLVTNGPSGAQYRLRDAAFAIQEYSWEYERGAGGESGTSPTSIVVSSEDDPDAGSINVDLEEGYYYLSLEPGWRLEKVGEEGAETVEATLLSDQTQWLWISRRETSWATFEFGLGERSIWMNGQLNIDLQVYEDPDELNGGYGGSPGNGGYGGYGGDN
jgi:hypothetical protein